MPGLRPSAALVAALSLLVQIAAARGGGNAEAPAYYDLKFSVEHRGEKLGEPRLLVEPGKPARIRVESDDRTSGYRLDVVARPSADHGERTIVVATKLYRLADGDWVLVAEPWLAVEPGKPASLSLERDPSESLSVDLVAEPVTRADAERMRKAWIAGRKHP